MSDGLSERLRLAWVNHLLATARRMEAKSRKCARRAEDCRVFARRHLKRLGMWE